MTTGMINFGNRWAWVVLVLLMLPGMTIAAITLSKAHRVSPAVIGAARSAGNTPVVDIKPVLGPIDER